MRRACARLCVTMSTEQRSFRRRIRCSIAVQEIGSSALQGSSNRMTSGSLSRARAMHSRCCSPPDKQVAESFIRSFRRSQRFTRRKASSILSA
mmetsp:Transcript_29638/g.58609  ORF Transcript_29638/g.58609 Transcript_29638/m.58609 type:complete len:93 (+) Transcript_29638:492-770(+)